MKASFVTSEILNLLEDIFPIEEKIIGNKFYIALPFRLKDQVKEIVAGTVGGRGGQSQQYTQVHDQTYYNMYKKGLSKWIDSDTSNYIYTFKKPLNVFLPDEYNIRKLMDVGRLDISELSELFLLDTGDVDKIVKETVNRLQSGKFTVDHLLAYCYMWSGVRSIFDGFVDHIGKTYVFVDVVLNNTILVDGNAIRFPSVGSIIDKSPIPDDKKSEWNKLIVPALVAYTAVTGVRLKPMAKKWLLENFRKPYSSIELYRGFSINFDLAQGTEADYLSKLKKQIGLKSWIKCVRGVSLDLKRGKESSWSTSPVISSKFSTGLGMGSISFLVKTKMPASRVIMDFSLLSSEDKKPFVHWSEQEVIIDAGPVPSVVIKMSVDDQFSKWLQSHGYQFIAQKGIVPK